MNIIQRLLGFDKTVNVTGQQSWDTYSSIIPNNKLLKQYYAWTKRAIKIKSNSVMTHPPVLYQDRRNETVALTEDEDPLLRDLTHFNPRQTYGEARRLIQIHKSLTGIGFFIMVKSSTPGYIREFYIGNPNNLLHNTVDDWGFPTSYKYRQVEGNDIVIPAESVILFKDDDPDNQTSGSSDLQASSYAHNSYSAAMNLNMNYFYNNAKPEAMYYLENASDDQVKAFERQFNSKFRGTKQSGKVAFLNLPVQAVEMTKTLRDMEFVEGIKLMREEILGIHGIPKEIAMGSGTYQNVKEAQRLFQQYTLQPELDIEADVYNEQLIPKYYGKSLKGYYFKSADAVDADRELDSKVADNMATAETKVKGTFTRNEIRAVVGLPRINGGDDLDQPVITATQRKFNEDRYIELVNTERTNYEKRIDLEVTKMLDRQRRMIISSKQNIDVIEQSEMMRKNLTKLSIEFAEKLQLDYLSQRGMGQSLPIGSLNWIQAYLLETSLYINNTTAKDIALIIKNLEAAGQLDSSPLTREVNKIFKQYNLPTEGDSSRINTISRTISGAIQGNTLHNMIINDRSARGRKWRSAQDGDVRDGHHNSSVQPVSLEEPFLVNGERLMYPGDPSGSASNIISCRCIEVPI